MGLAAFAIGILAVPSLAVADIGPTTCAQVDQALARLLSYRNSISIDRPIPLGRALHEIATYLAPGEIPMRVSPLVRLRRPSLSKY